MSFQRKKVHISHDENGQEYYTIIKTNPAKKWLIGLVTFVICFSLIYFAWGFARPYLQTSLKWIGQSAVTVISKTAGEEPKRDEK